VLRPSDSIRFLVRWLCQPQKRNIDLDNPTEGAGTGDYMIFEDQLRLLLPRGGGAHRGLLVLPARGSARTRTTRDLPTSATPRGWTGLTEMKGGVKIDEGP
jgi:hypothetical protein